MLFGSDAVSSLGMMQSDGVLLRGGPCDGERPEPLPGTTFSPHLDAITVMDHGAGVGHHYEMTDKFVFDADVRCRILVYRRTVPRAAVGMR